MNRRTFLRTLPAVTIPILHSIQPARSAQPEQPNRLLIVDGNSLSCLANTTLPNEWARSISVNCPVVDVAVAGDHITPILRRAPYYVDPLIKQFRDTLIILWEGTNSLWKMSPEDAATKHIEYVRLRRKLGARVIVGTVINRNQASWPEHEFLRWRFNQLIRVNRFEFDGLMDIGASAELGAGDSAKGPLFRDGVHLTADGYAIVARYAQQAINSIWGAPTVARSQSNDLFIPLVEQGSE